MLSLAANHLLHTLFPSLESTPQLHAVAECQREALGLNLTVNTNVVPPWWVCWHTEPNFLVGGHLHLPAAPRQPDRCLSIGSYRQMERGPVNAAVRQLWKLLRQDRSYDLLWQELNAMLGSETRRSLLVETPPPLSVQGQQTLERWYGRPLTEQRLYLVINCDPYDASFRLVSIRYAGLQMPRQIATEHPLCWEAMVQEWRGAYSSTPHRLFAPNAGGSGLVELRRADYERNPLSVSRDLSRILLRDAQPESWVQQDLMPRLGISTPLGRSDHQRRLIVRVS